MRFTVFIILQVLVRGKIGKREKTLVEQWKTSLRLLSGLPCPPPGDLPDPGIEPKSPAIPALADFIGNSLLLSHLGRPIRHLIIHTNSDNINCFNHLIKDLLL